MFGLPSLAIYGIAALALLVSGFGGGWKVASDHFAAGQLAAEREAGAKLLAENLRANDIAKQLETEKAKQHVVYRTVTKQVDRIVETPVYRDTVCLDAPGVQLVNRAFAASGDPGGAGAAVPASRPSDGGNGGGGAAEAR